jgi:type I restriction enzyme S subunit
MVSSHFSEWEILPLEDCMEAIIDYRGKTPDKTRYGIPLITAKIVKGGQIQKPEEFISPNDYDSWMRRGLPKAGDILITTEAPLGEVAQLDNRTVALAQRLITLRGKQNLLDNTFLKFLMQSEFIQEQLKSRASGSTVSGIKQSELRKIDLPVPPLPTQHAIARILGSLDDKIELNRQMSETLEAMARAIFQSWFVDFDPVRAKAEGRQPAGMDAETAALFPSEFEEVDGRVVPRGWGVRTIGELTTIVGGSTPSTTNPEYWENGTHHFATPKDLAGLSTPILLDVEKKITDSGVDQISSRILPIGTILLSSRAPIGYIAFTTIPVSINQGFIAIICDKDLPNYYVLSWVSENLPLIIDRANGTTFLEISKSNFKPMKVIIPPTEILNKFVQQVKPLYAKIENNEQQSRILAQIRDALLPKLMSGEFSLNQ